MALIRLELFFDADDSHEGRPLAEQLLRYLLRSGIQGASVLAPVSGFGAKRRVHEPTRLGNVDESPRILVVVDDDARLRQLLPFLRVAAPGARIVVTPAESWGDGAPAPP